MNSSQFARMLVRLIAVVLVVLSVVRAADFILSFLGGAHHSFGGFISGLLHTAVPVGVAALVIAVGESIAAFLSKGNES